MAFSFLQNTNLDELAVGKYPIQGDSIYALVNEYDTKVAESITYEAHKKYVDLQYIVRGVERIGFSSLKGSKEVRSYADKEDYALYQADGSFVKVDAGMFAIFFPTDLHMPGISEESGSVSNVKKIVIKISL